jgi:hypothetical protein
LPEPARVDLPRARCYRVGAIFGVAMTNRAAVPFLRVPSVRLQRALVAWGLLAGVAGCQCYVGVSALKAGVKMVAPPGKDTEFERTIDFGGIRLTSAQTQPITLHNLSRVSSNVTVQIDTTTTDTFCLQLGPKSPCVVAGKATSPMELTAGADFMWTVRYRPTAIASDEATITVKTTAASTPQYIVHVKGQGAQSKIDVCSTDTAGAEICASSAPDGVLVVDMGTVAPGAPVVPKPLVIKDVAALALQVSSIAPTPSTSSEFTVTPNHGPVQVDPNTSTTYQLNFAPLYGGPHEGVIQIDSDDPGNPSVLVKVHGLGDGPALCFNPVPPAPVEFGDVSVGATAHQTLTVTSCGTRAANIVSMALDTGVNSQGAARAVFGSTNLNTGAQTLQPGDHLDLDMTYAPTELDTNTGHVLITYATEQGNTRGSISLHGNGVGCALVAQPTAVSFGTVSVGGRGSKIVTVTNTGTSPCSITGTTTSGAPFDVSNAPANPTAVDPGDTLPITVTYSPTTLGSAHGTLTIASNALGGGLNVDLSGIGQTPPPCDLQPAPSSLSFTGVSQGATANQNVVLTNYGSADCDVVYVKVKPATGTGPADFSATIASSTPVNFVPITVASGASVAMKTSFTPSSSSQESANIEVDYCQTGASSCTSICSILGDCSSLPHLNIPASGGALPAKVCVMPTTLDFGPISPGQSRDLPFTITSCGQGALTLRGLKFEAGSSRKYTIASSVNVPLVLAPNASRQIVVHYAPTTTTGDFGQVAVLSNDPADPKVLVQLKGNITSTCDKQLLCNPDILVFPTMETGRTASLSLVCSNAGTQTVTVTGVGFTSQSSSAFNGSVGRTPAIVPPGGTIRVQVDYTPTVAGTDTGTISVTSDACMAPTADLQGTGRVPNYPPCLPPQNFSPVVKWNWTGQGAVQPMNNNVAMSPIVVNLTDDNGDGRIDVNDIPEVLFTTCSADKCAKLNLMDQSMSDISGIGILRAVHGKDGSSYFDVTATALQLGAVTQLAAGDLDGDNIPEIVAVKHTFHAGTGMGGFSGKYIDGTLLVFDHTGRLEFETDHWTGDVNAGEFGSAPAIADLDGDGHPEIVFERTVFHYDGTKWYDMDRSGNWGHGAFPTLADVDGDGSPEIISGAYVYKANGTLLWKAGGNNGAACDPSALTACLGTGGMCDPVARKCIMYSGPTMVLDVDGDGTPEVILRDGAQSVKVLNGVTGQQMASATWPPIPMSLNGDDNGICPAAMSAADLDGDGGAEIIIPAGDYIYTFKYTGSSTLQQLWKYPIVDYGGQCGASGSAAFDFSGDGKYDVVYHDTSHMWVFRGTDGTMLYNAPRSSATIFETPVIADVDNDGHADMLMTNEGGALGVGLAGLQALSNQGNTWPATRRIWSDHAYHITEISDDGTIPRLEAPPTRNNNSWRAQAPLCTPHH